MVWIRAILVSLMVNSISRFFVNGQGCTSSGACSCNMDDGSGEIKLDTLSKNDGTAAFPDMAGPDGWSYSYNPCDAFNEGNCNNAAACQAKPDTGEYYTIGYAGPAFSFDGLNVHVTYNGDGGRITDVVLVCDPNTDANLVPNGENPSLTYTFTLTTKCACPGLCAGGPDPTPTPGPGPDPGNTDSDSSISIGTILCIAALAIMVVYLVSGIAFQKLGRHATGKEVIPNVTLWEALPGLIKEGFVFTFSKCRKGSYSSI